MWLTRPGMCQNKGPLGYLNSNQVNFHIICQHTEYMTLGFIGCISLEWFTVLFFCNTAPDQCNAERVISSGFWWGFYSQVLLITVLIIVLDFNLQCRFAKQRRSLFFNKKEAAKRKQSGSNAFSVLRGFLRAPGALYRNWEQMNHETGGAKYLLKVLPVNRDQL